MKKFYKFKHIENTDDLTNLKAIGYLPHGIAGNNNMELNYDADEQVLCDFYCNALKEDLLYHRIENRNALKYCCNKNCLCLPCTTCLNEKGNCKQ